VYFKQERRETVNKFPDKIKLYIFFENIPKFSKNALTKMKIGAIIVVSVGNIPKNSTRNGVKERNL